MKRYLKSLALAALLGACAIPSTQAQNIKREFRSTWISTVWGLDWPGSAGQGTTTAIVNAQKQLLTDYLDRMKEANMTGVCLQVRSRADAYYNSSFAPWTSDVSGTRGTNPGWDPLAFAVEEAHKRGLELYAWINPYRWSTSSDWTTTLDKQWINNGWIITHGTSKYLNPGIKGVHDLIINVVDEIVSGYAVDGLIIDDYFYPNGISKGTDASDYQTYESSGTSLSIGDWRRQNVNTLVADIHKKIMDVRPDVRFGIGPPGVSGASAATYGLPTTSSYGITASDWQYDGQYTDPLQWMFSGNIDFISPQIYWHTTHSTAPYGPLTNWWSNAAAKAGRHHYSSMSISDLASNNTESYWEEYAQEVRLNRQYTQNDAPGYCLFRTAFISGPTASGLGTYLVQNVSPGKALHPEVTWKTAYRHEYDAPSDAKLSGSTLEWNGEADGNRIVRYSVYAVPSSVSKDNAQASNGDGISADYLLGVSYTPSFDLPADRASGYWYAVCLYDGFGHEHPAAYINYTEPVTPPDDPDDPDKYVPTVEGVDYPAYGTYQLQNIWINSAAPQWGNFSQESAGSLNRGFVVCNDGLYISGRDANSSTANLYLAHYDRLTGEFLGNIDLKGGQCKYYPCNDVIKDDADNIIITNLTLNIATTPLYLYKVDVENGNVWQQAELTYSGTGRIDHCAVSGDVTGDFTVWAAIASSNKIVRWKVTTGGEVTATEVCTLGDFYPQEAAHLGIAPIITGIKGDTFYVNGSNTALTRYTFKANQTINADDSFLNSDPAIQPGATHNGGSVFTYGTFNLMVSPVDNHEGLNGGYRWSIYKADKDFSYKSLESLYTFPANGMGTNNNNVCQAQTDYYIDPSEENDGSYIYAYAPGNGVAAYKFYNSDLTGVDRPTADAKVSIAVYGRQVCLSDVAESIELFTPSGMLVASAKGEGGLYCDVAPGLYIIRVIASGNVTTDKVIIR